MPNYQKIAQDSRKKVLSLIFSAQTSHIGSNFSCADIMAVLFEKIDLDKDKFILSAGWKAAMLYYHLWRKGRITQEELNSYCMPGSKWIGLSEPIHPDIPFAGGSMGMGLPAAVGFALAKKMKDEEGKVYCLISDGEMQVGTTMESAKIAVQNQLDNLIVIEDKNGWQAMGKTEDILISNEFEEFSAYGFHVIDIEGHNFREIERSIMTPEQTHYDGSLACEHNKGTIKTESTPWLEQCKICSHDKTDKLIDLEYNGDKVTFAEKKKLIKNMPVMIIARTIKGKGVSFMEGVNLYHYKQLSSDEYERAKKELQ